MYVDRYNSPKLIFVFQFFSRKDSNFPYTFQHVLCNSGLGWGGGEGVGAGAGGGGGGLSLSYIIFAGKFCHKWVEFILV